MKKYLSVVGDKGKILFWKWIYYCENDFILISRRMFGMSLIGGAMRKKKEMKIIINRNGDNKNIA